MDDPTLRRGDIVVTRDGPMVFTGASRAKNREQAFVPAADYPGLSKSMRQELTGMRIAKVANETASLPAGVTPATSPIPVGLAYQPEQTVVADAFASFARQDALSQPSRKSCAAARAPVRARETRSPPPQAG
jgi:hypothetical protein